MSSSANLLLVGSSDSFSAPWRRTLRDEMSPIASAVFDDFITYLPDIQGSSAG